MDDIGFSQGQHVNKNGFRDRKLQAGLLYSFWLF